MSITSLISPYLGTALSIEALKKFSPQVKNFIGYGLAAGYGTDQILDFMRSKMESESFGAEKERLEKGVQQGGLRPDEQAASAQISENERLPNLIEGGAKLAGRVAGGALGSGLLGGIGDNEESPVQDQNPQPATPNPIASQEPQQLQKPPKQQQEKGFLDQFPQLMQAAQKGLQEGLSPENVYQALMKHPSYSGLVKKYEESEGRSFLENIYEISGQKGQSGQNQPSSSQERLLKILQSRPVRK